MTPLNFFKDLRLTMSPLGRVLNDVFIYPTHHSISYITNLSSTLDHNDPGYFVEVDADEASKLYTHLRRYKLRSKLAIRLLDDEEWSIWSTWGDHANRPKANTERGENEDDVEDAPPSDDIGCLDPRAPLMGRRVVLSSFSSPPDSSTQQPLSAYHIRRTLLGVAEGQREILTETALPLESNMDYMNGIDFRKGCYVGQELTIRTRHTGVVRKRILPVRLYPADETSRPPSRLEHDDTVLHTGQIEMPTPGTNVVRMDGGDGRKRNVGRWLDGVGNIGFALCRLDPMKKMMIQPDDDQSWAADGEFGAEWVRDGETYLGGKVKMRAFWPDWFPDIGG
ncbi:MAG: hypothetical protein M1825_003415 [Sarcosagium campestre]|nr:MAG: hypothetical protein M1825_003415 [Sarcosagium campestre]